MTRLTRISVR